MRRRGGAPNSTTSGVMTRSQRKMMELKGYKKTEKVVEDAEMDEYIQNLDEKIDATHERENVTWEDYESSSEEEVELDEDDEDDEEFDWSCRQRLKTSPITFGFWSNLFWSSGGLLLVIPVLYYRLKYSAYPLGNSSILGYFMHALRNWLAIFFLICFGFAGICNTEPFLNGFLFKFPSAVEECGLTVWNQANECILIHGPDVYLEPLCHIPLGQIAGLLLLIVLLFRFYSKRVQALLALLFIAHHGLQWKASLIAPKDNNHAPVITSLDPSFAYANETIRIIIDGVNLYEGLPIVWVEYWGCSKTTDIAECPKKLSSSIKNGGITVSFPNVDEYTICVQPTTEASIECFESVRLKVKDIKSKPGWSLS